MIKIPLLEFKFSYHNNVKNAYEKIATTQIEYFHLGMLVGIFVFLEVYFIKKIGFLTQGFLSVFYHFPEYRGEVSIQEKASETARSNISVRL